MRAPLLLCLVACGGKPVPLAEPPAPIRSSVLLSDASSFEAIDARLDRSVAVFHEMNKVLTHPRCSNCHPSDDRPRQGMARAVHEPPVWRGEAGHGVAAMQCATCHQDHNTSHSRMPGAPHWHLAPPSMAWMGHSPASICRQIKDPTRNGDRSLEDLYEHMSNDALVGWAWDPGADREPAPGTQAQFAELVRLWIDTGAHCPEESP